MQTWVFQYNDVDSTIVSSNSSWVFQYNDVDSTNWYQANTWYRIEGIWPERPNKTPVRNFYDDDPNGL